MSDPNVHRVAGLSFRAIVLDGKVELAISTDIRGRRSGYSVMLPSATIVSGDMDQQEADALACWLEGLAVRVAQS